MQSSKSRKRDAAVALKPSANTSEKKQEQENGAATLSNEEGNETHVEKKVKTNEAKTDVNGAAEGTKAEDALDREAKAAKESVRAQLEACFEAFKHRKIVGAIGDARVSHARVKASEAVVKRMLTKEFSPLARRVLKPNCPVKDMCAGDLEHVFDVPMSSDVCDDQGVRLFTVLTRDSIFDYDHATQEFSVVCECLLWKL